MLFLSPLFTLALAAVAVLALSMVFSKCQASTSNNILNARFARATNISHMIILLFWPGERHHRERFGFSIQLDDWKRSYDLEHNDMASRAWLRTAQSGIIL